ncbi:hypothetical protein [Microvirga sp. KLBC 81]|nr:hypothetical protein [Microvirga sp. KLBC 81]
MFIEDYVETGLLPLKVIVEQRSNRKPLELFGAVYLENGSASRL